MANEGVVPTPAAELIEGLFHSTVALLDGLSVQGRHSLARLTATLKAETDALGDEIADARALARMGRGIDPDEIVRRVRAGGAEQMSSREVRAALREFPRLEPAHIQALLQRVPAARTTFIKAVRERWDQALERPSLLALVATEVRQPYVHDSNLAQQISRDLPPDAGTVASMVDGGALVVGDFRLNLEWALAGYVLLEWVKALLPGPQAGAVWSALRGSERLSAAILPRATNAILPSHTPPRNRAEVLGSFLHAALIERQFDSEERLADLQRCALESEFGDPRLGDPKGEWKWIQHQGAPAAYEAFLERLIAEDLEFFFRHAEADPARESFWLRYKSSAKRSVCILAPEKYRQLEAQSALSPAARGALHRAKRLLTGTVSAFVLYFERRVVVEFSEIGNAAYVYPGDWFKSHLDRAEYASHAELKARPTGYERIVHRDGWQRDAADLLPAMGIHPSRGYLSANGGR